MWVCSAGGSATTAPPRGVGGGACDTKARGFSRSSSPAVTPPISSPERSRSPSKTRGRQKAQAPVRIEEPFLGEAQDEGEGGGGGHGEEERMMGSLQSLTLDVPHIVYSFSSDEESEGEGESIIRIEAKYLGMMGRKVRRD